MLALLINTSPGRISYSGRGLSDGGRALFPDGLNCPNDTAPSFRTPHSSPCAGRSKHFGLHPFVRSAIDSPRVVTGYLPLAGSRSPVFCRMNSRLQRSMPDQFRAKARRVVPMPPISSPSAAMNSDMTACSCVSARFLASVIRAWASLQWSTMACWICSGGKGTSMPSRTDGSTLLRPLAPLTKLFIRSRKLAMRNRSFT